MSNEIKDLIKIAEDTLSNVEHNGWTIQVHTNCLAILRRLTELKAALTGGKE